MAGSRTFAPVKPQRIAIVGYGTGGQSAGLMLAADGHTVDVFERAPAPGPVGAGFLLQPVGLAVLWELGLLDAVLRHGAPVTRLYGETVSGQPVMDMRYAELATGLVGLGLQRGALFELLDDAWQENRRLHCGHAIVAVDADRGTLTDDAGNEHGPFDLIIVADGAQSKLRAQVRPAKLDQPYPWGAWWCLVDAADWPWADELRQRYVAARRMAGMLPVGSRPGDPARKLSFFWSAPCAALERGIAEPDAWRDDVAAVWPDAAQRLQATMIPAGLAVARYRDVVHRGWSRGRAVLLGDAAHAMSPQLGQGVNMALLDARALRDALRVAATPTDAVQSYEQERRAHVGIYHLWSRWLTPLFQSDHDRIAWCRDRVFHTMSRLPGSRGQALRVLTGTRRGWFGTMGLPEGLIDALADRPAVEATR
jgi:FAD-dependent urate hydroxylase